MFVDLHKCVFAASRSAEVHGLKVRNPIALVHVARVERELYHPPQPAPRNEGGTPSDALVSTCFPLPASVLWAKLVVGGPACLM